MRIKKVLFKKCTILIAVFMIAVGTFTLSYAGGVGNLIKDTSSRSTSRSSSSRRSSSSGIAVSTPLFLVIAGVYVIGKNGRKMNLPKEVVEPCEKVCALIEQYKGSKNDGSEVPTPNQLNNTEYISYEIIKWDEEFSANRFLSWSKEVFIKVNEAWTKKDWSVIRPFEHESLFALHSAQLESYIQNKTTNMITNIAIDSAYLYTYDRDNTDESVKVLLYTTLHSYVIDDRSGDVIDGNPDDMHEVPYLMTFMRHKNVKTSSKSNKSTSQCPVCGAPTEITSSGKCSYCQNIITTGQHDWVLTHFEVIDDHFVLDHTPVTITATNENTSVAPSHEAMQTSQKDASEPLAAQSSCPSCGADGQNAKFCSFCGEEINKAS